MKRVILVAGLLAIVTGLSLVTPAMAQTKTVELRSGEVLAVDGNVLTARGPEGVKQFVVPEDFRFDMDGQKLSVHELKPGMKITAMITTTETPLEVTATEVREVAVVFVTSSSIIVRNLETNETRKFTAAELKDKNLIVYRNGERVEMSGLKKGDRISATIVTKRPPEIVTEQELKAFVSKPAPPPPPPKTAAAAPPPPKPSPAAETAPPPAKPAHLPKTGSALPLVGLAGVVLLGLGVGASALRGLLTRG
jgi:hypothetical protein